MKHIVFHLDFISPYAYLAFERLPVALEGLSYAVEHRPVLFAGLLKHHRQLGPAEIPGKREWTFRQVAWLASREGVALDLPAAHPFNPLALLRLAVATARKGGAVNRYVCERVFRHVWRGGADALDAERLEALTSELAPSRDPASEAVKGDLKANTDAAIAQGAFGVPAFEVDGRMFWGLDALPMLRAVLMDDPWFASDAWDAAARLPTGVTRNRTG